MNRRRVFMAVAMLVASLACALPQPASAHSQSYGYLTVRIAESGLAGQVELAVRDLDLVHDLDANGDGSITWGEFRLRENSIADATLRQLSISGSSGPCTLLASPALVDTHGGENYMVLPFTSSCGAAASATLDYGLMFDRDAQHRGLVNISTPNGDVDFIATPQSHSFALAPGETSWLAALTTYVTHGVHHILIGYDHILFLLTLILGTAMFQRERGLRRLFFETAKVVTAFTLSHSVTLGLAATGSLDIPSWIAESLIAATIVISAFNNVLPVITRRLWLVALFFGLIHGVGFASVLTDLGLPRDNLLVSLLAFNLGVEIGQLAIVLVALPVIALATRLAVGRFTVPAVNWAIAGVAMIWLSDRALGTMLMPF